VDRGKIVVGFECVCSCMRLKLNCEGLSLGLTAADLIGRQMAGGCAFYSASCKASEIGLLDSVEGRVKMMQLSNGENSEMERSAVREEEERTWDTWNFVEGTTSPLQNRVISMQALLLNVN
jgi:hypothetical protein